MAVFRIARRRLPALLVLAAGLPLLVALGAEHIGGLAPCPLCIWQRWPYAAALLLGLAGFAAGGRPALLRALLALAALAFLASAAIAAFHVGVEQGWWQGTAACGGGVAGAGLSAAELAAALLEAPAVRCDRVAWSLFGISMAGYNFLYATAAGLAALRLAARRGEGAEHGRKRPAAA